MFSVRRANIDDLQLIVDFQIKMAVESEGVDLEEATINSGVGAVLKGEVTAEYWLVESEDGPVGMMMTLPEWSDWRNGVVIWIHSVYVRPDYRKKGAFSTLFEHLKNQVSESSELVGLRLYVDKGNHSAQQVYKRLGMSAEHYDIYEFMKY